MIQYIASGQADEHIGAHQSISKFGAGRCIVVGKFTFFAIQIGAAGVDQTFGVKHEHVRFFGTQTMVKFGAGNGRSTRAIDHDFDFVNFLTYNFQCIQQGCCADDGSAVLVVVHYRDIQLRFKAFFDFKTLGGGDVFQVDAPKSRLQNFYGPYKFVYILGVQLQVENIDIGVDFKQQAFALHYGFTCCRANVAQTQYRSSIGNHGDQVALGGVFVNGFGIGLNFEARLGYTGGIGQGQVALGSGFLGGNHFDFPRASFGVVM